MIGPPIALATASARERCPIADADLARARVDQARDDRARGPSGAQDHHRAGIRPPVGLRITQALHVAVAVVVVAGQRAVGLDHDRVDRADAPRDRIDAVDQFHRGDLVRNRDVAAGKAQRRQAFQRGRESLRLHRQQHVGAGQAVLLQPVAVQHRRSRMADRPTHDPCQAVLLPFRHRLCSFVRFRPVASAASCNASRRPRGRPVSVPFIARVPDVSASSHSAALRARASIDAGARCRYSSLKTSNT